MTNLDKTAQLVRALDQARQDLLTVGNDYPGSSCQKWCTERAQAAWSVVESWKHCPSTHCERREECASPNECSANRSSIAKTFALADGGAVATDRSHVIGEAPCETARTFWLGVAALYHLAIADEAMASWEEAREHGVEFSNRGQQRAAEHRKHAIAIRGLGAPNSPALQEGDPQ